MLFVDGYKLVMLKCCVVGNVLHSLFFVIVHRWVGSHGGLLRRMDY